MELEFQVERDIEDSYRGPVRDRDRAIPIEGRTVTKQCPSYCCLYKRSLDGGRNFVGRSFEVPDYIFESEENEKVREEYCQGVWLPGDWFGLEKKAIFVTDREFSNGAIVSSDGKVFCCSLECLRSLRED